MDIKVIVDKALKGEDYSAELKDVPEAEQAGVYVAIKNAAKEEADKEFARKQALKKDGERIDEKKKTEEKNIFEKFQTEQFEKAKARFFSDSRFTFKDEPTKQKVVEEFAKINSGSVDSENIFNDLKKAYALVNSDELLNQREKLVQFEKGAIDYNSMSANAKGGAGGKDEGTYSQTARELYVELQKSGFKKTLDECEALVKKGGKWKTRDLSA